MKVELITYTPNPDDVCGRAAKTCTNAGGVPEKGEVKTLKGALSSGHESVAEHASFTFAIEGVSRALSHQLVRHRMASYSQQSQRYVNMEGFDYVSPKSIESSNKTVTYMVYDDETEGFNVKSIGICNAYDKIMHDIAFLYREMVEAGIPEEDARYILPNACCTNIVVTMNARELRHFFKLRCCERAQWEIRELANKMLARCKEVAPVLFEKAGASCVATGKCPEGKRSCGKVKKGQERSKRVGLTFRRVKE